MAGNVSETKKMKVLEKYSEVGRRHQALKAKYLQFPSNLPQKDLFNTGKPEF